MQNIPPSTNQRRYIFGATSAIITNLGLITGLYFTPNAQINIIGSIMVIALADNISDSLGIHIYQEADHLSTREIWLSTFTNFATRLSVSLVFILIVVFFPLYEAILYLIILGLLLLSIISYIIAKNRKINPVRAIAEHLLIAAVVIFLSKYLGNWITSKL